MPATHPGRLWMGAPGVGPGRGRGTGLHSSGLDGGATGYAPPDRRRQPAGDQPSSACAAARGAPPVRRRCPHHKRMISLALDRGPRTPQRPRGARHGRQVELLPLVRRRHVPRATAHRPALHGQGGRLHGVVQAFPPGHRIRPSLSTSYRTLVRHAPEPVLLTAYENGSALNPPVRDARRRHRRGAAPFGVSEGCAPPAVTRLSEPERASRLRRLGPPGRVRILSR